jgi:CDP-diacylglycerol pyrophosphatase
MNDKFKKDICSRASQLRLALISLTVVLASCGDGSGYGWVSASSGAVALTQCPQINTSASSSDANHWFSPSAKNNDDTVVNQCNSCLDPENQKHKSCKVYSHLTSEICAGKSCADEQGYFHLYRDASLKFALQHDLRYQNPDIYPRAKSEGCRFILWALDPVIGSEDSHHRTHVNYWRQAYLSSQKLVVPPYAVQSVALAIQPAITRGQHQLHIHIGTLKSEYIEVMRTLKIDPLLMQTAQVGGYQFYIRYVPNQVSGEPYTGENLFNVAVALLPNGEKDMASHGILAATSPAGDGIYVMVARGFDRSELNYIQEKPCGFNNTDKGSLEKIMSMALKH